MVGLWQGLPQPWHYRVPGVRGVHRPSPWRWRRRVHLWFRLWGRPRGGAGQRGCGQEVEGPGPAKLTAMSHEMPWRKSPGWLVRDYYPDLRKIYDNQIIAFPICLINRHEIASLSVGFVMDLFCTLLNRRACPALEGKASFASLREDPGWVTCRQGQWHQCLLASWR